jgi:hypothetical protein
VSDTNHPRVTVTANVAIRQRPTLMLMLVRVRAAEATLELGLAEVKKRGAEAAHRLARLGASNVEVGEPHADDQADPDPMAKMRAAAMPRALRRAGEAAPAERRGVNVLLTAKWDISSLPAEDALLLVDRLRFEAAADAAEHPAEQPPAPSPWAGPEEQLREMMAQMAQLTQPSADLSPQFLYVARLTDDLQAKAAAEAYATAREKAGRLAHAAGRKLGELASLHTGPFGLDTRSDLILERQRCVAWLAASSYHLVEGESVSESLRAAEFSVSVTATFLLD